MDYIKEIADALNNNHAVAMIGAGFSKNAIKTTSSDKYFKNWNELSDEFYNLIYKDIKNDESKKFYYSSTLLAQEVEISFGRTKLDTILKDSIPDKDYSPSNLHKDLLNLSWRDVFTTNYDTLLERTADMVTDRRYNVVLNQEDLVNSNDAPRIIKLHGSFPSQRPFIITEEDYRTYPKRFAAMVNTVQQALLENVFCMIGFSCEDPNFLNWIGWIHDNLGRSSSQKLYMVSVEPVNEARQKMLFDKNIIVIDLVTMYPEKNAEERLTIFFKKLKELTSESKRKNDWFDLKDIHINEDTTIEGKIHILKSLNKTYPGWLFLPWEIKLKANVFLNYLSEEYSFLDKEKLEDLSIDKQIEYMYEYLSFLDIVGRPIISNTAYKYWKILDNKNGCFDQSSNQSQYIYLQLLRAFRELADWEKYDICRKKIKEESLEYERKQFLYSNDWWMRLYRFTDDNLVETLNKWQIASDDLYWPSIQSSMYALVGEINKSEQILCEILPKIRKKLTLNSKDVFYSSLEESVVSLLNFIKKGRWHGNSQLERTYQSESLNWADENQNFCYQLNEQSTKRHTSERRVNFDLSVTYVSYEGYGHKSFYYALDYLRFLEKTAHPFRVQFVVNKDGFHNAINNLCFYYPNWCLIQMLIVGDNKELDSLFARKTLCKFTQDEVDEITKEYLRILLNVSENIKSSSRYRYESLYDTAIDILPEIISRLCTKCSVTMLDEIFNQVLMICNSNIRTNFKRIDFLIKSLVQAYSLDELANRIESFLKFPINILKNEEYHDPIRYIEIPEKKYNISVDSYQRQMTMLYQYIEQGTNQDETDALNRFIKLSYLIDLQEVDREYLYHALSENGSDDYQEILYFLDKERFASSKRKIFENTIQLIKNDSKKGFFACHAINYSRLINILSECILTSADFLELFTEMIQLLEKNIEWEINSISKFDIEERTSQSLQIAIGLLLLKIKNDQMTISSEELNVVTKYFEKLKEYYQNSHVIDFIASFLISMGYRNKKSTNMFTQRNDCLWELDNIDFKLLKIFYDELKQYHIYSNDFDELKKYSNRFYQMTIYRIVNVDYNRLLPALKLLESLLLNHVMPQKETKRLVFNLLGLMKLTTINSTDSEKDARNKLNCRIQLCKIVKLYYIQGRKHKNILAWKDLTKDSKEFSEIRRIDFDE
ncbi:SIR2 family NAD-dependent protein deacylase [Holdemanella biformis]